MKRSRILFLVAWSPIVLLILFLLQARVLDQGTTLNYSVTPTSCPRATPEPLWVEPVISPTTQQTQTVTIYLGNGEAVTVTTNIGTFSEQGSFDYSSNPAKVAVSLQPNASQLITVTGKVRTVMQGPCEYGGYTLTTTSDRYGNPLNIRQGPSGSDRKIYLPLINISAAK